MGYLVGIVTGAFLFVVYWFFIRTEREMRLYRIKMLNDLKEGDYVETLGGLRGIAYKVDNHKKVVEIDCEGIYLVFNKDGIAKVITKAENIVSDIPKVIKQESEDLIEELPLVDSVTEVDTPVKTDELDESVVRDVRTSL